MMAANFRTRPWQLTPLARPTFAPVPLHNTTPGIQAQMQQIRRATMPKKRSAIPLTMRPSVRNSQRHSREQKATTSVAEVMRAEQMAGLAALSPYESAVMAPRTLIPLSPSKALSLNYTPWQLVRYYFEIARQRFMDRLQIMRETFRLKERTWQRATFRASRKGIVAEALRLHADMSQSLAEGGKQAAERLGRVCVPKLSRSLVAAIEARPRGKTYRWERVKLTGTPFWPRLVDHKWTEAEVGYLMSFRQAVVGIKSLQKLTELQNGKVVGTKEMDVLEYVVLWCHADKEKKTMGEWQIYGTLKQTTREDMEREVSMMRRMGDLMAEESLGSEKKKARA